MAVTNVFKLLPPHQQQRTARTTSLTQ
jgi:hypothetical protein